MTFDHMRRQRVLRRYRIMFKASLAEIAFSVLTIAAGVLIALDSARTEIIGWGFVLLILSVVGAYKILNSTVRLLEHEARDRNWRGLEG